MRITGSLEDIDMLTPEEIDEICEAAVAVALETDVASSKYVATDGEEYVIPILRAYPNF